MRLREVDARLRASDSGASRAAAWNVMINLCFVALVACAVGPLFAVFSIFDAIVRRQHEHARAAWERDGSSRGYFWRAPDRSAFAGGFRRDLLMRSWLFETPAWARERDELLRLFTWLRISVAGWLIVAVGGGAAVYAMC